MNIAENVATKQTQRLAISFKLMSELLGRAVQFATLGLVARSLSLTDFGWYGLALTCGFLLAQLSDSGLHLLVTRQLGRTPDSTFINRACTTKFFLAIGLIFCSLVGVFFTNFSWAFGLLVISNLVYSLAEFGFAVLRGQNRLHYEAALVIAYRVSLFVGVLLAFLTTSGLNGIAIAYIVANSFVMLASLYAAKVRPAGSFDWLLLRRAVPIGLAILLSLLAFKIDVPLLQILTNRPDEVGLYNAAYKLFEPLLLFPAALMAGYFPTLSRTAQELGYVKFNKLVRRLVGILVGGGIAVGLSVALLANWAIQLLFGDGYVDAAPTLVLLALAVPFLFVNSGLTHALLALDRERLYLFFFAATLTLNVGTNFVLIPRWGQNGAAVATLLTEAALTLMCVIALLRTIKSKTAEVASTPHSSTALRQFPLTLNHRDNNSIVSQAGQTSPSVPTKQRSLLGGNAVIAKVNKVGFGLLLALIICLPFELNQHPFLTFEPWLVLNNLKLLYYANILVALITIWLERHKLKEYLLNWRTPKLWLMLLVVTCIVSTIFSVVPKESIKFTLDLLLGAILWLALPFWIEEQRQRKLQLIVYCLVGAGAVSAGLGLLEFVPGLKLDNWLLAPFKEGATVAGPFLRLSGTFEYANIAAIFYELVLPFALANLALVASTPLNTKWRWIQLGLWAMACGLLWEALLLSFSRSALPGMLVAAPIIFLAVRRIDNLKRWKRSLGFGLGLGLGLIVVSLLVSPVMVLRFKTQSDQGWYLASYNAPTLTNLKTCQQLDVPVTVHNLTPLDWNGGPDGAYHLSYHWLDQPNHIYQFEGVRSVMPNTLKAGAQAVVEAQLRTPDKVGHYWLVWDVVEEDVSWFSLKSANYQKQEVDVATNSNGCNLPVGPIATKVQPTSLPQTPPNPERGQLWKIAQKMIVARPFFGVGPDAYRFAYGSYAGVKVWDTRIFANSTPLELTADLGIVGFVLFTVFAGLASWPIIANGWRGRLGLFEAAALAALVAFGLHGILDYFLGFHAIFILLWLLLGIATSFSLQISPNKHDANE